MKSSSWKQVRAAFKIEADALTQMVNVIDKGAFDQAVKAIQKADRIAATGCGHSGIACMHFAHLMCCIEKSAKFISPAEAIHGGMGFIQKGDILLWVSRGGKTTELFPILNIARGKSALIIGVTENSSSPLAQASDIILAMAVEKEVDKNNSQGTASFCVTNAIFDALQTALIEETGFRNEQFAVIHPGGAIGERLNRKENNNS
jgi:D-arabinose 5-phosphate isomerase GutQ